MKNYKFEVNRFKLLQNKIKEHSQSIIIPNNLEKTNVNITTDIEIIKSTSDIPIVNDEYSFKNDVLKNEPIKTRKYLIFPTDNQIVVFQKWFNAYIDMYNHVIQYIKNEFRNGLQQDNNLKLVDLKIDLSLTNLKKKFSEFKTLLGKNYNVNMHTLDYAISDAVAMYKSKISNLEGGHIKKSRLRYLKKTKQTVIFKVEKQFCTYNSFCVTHIGDILQMIPKINLQKEVESVLIVQYNRKTNKYYLCVRKEIIKNDPLIDEIDNVINETNSFMKTSNDYLKVMANQSNMLKKTDKANKTNVSHNRINENTGIKQIKDLNKELTKTKRQMKYKKQNINKYNIRHSKPNSLNEIAFDPGIRTFLTGLSNDHIIEIGTTMAKMIERRLKAIDNINNNKNISIAKKKKIVQRRRNNIKNKIDDYHWKTIKYITSNYRYVSIGNFSTKEMVENDIHKMIKRIGQLFRFYVFHQRLQYKCFLNGIKYYKSDEYCTSKTCSNCGYFKKDLGSNKIYNCNRCGMKLDRDINASKNIYMISII